jgi:hypothetical protein
MAFTYSLSENNTVNIYTDGQPDPVIIQPNWPNGTPWASPTEATSWAELCIAAMQDPAAPYAPAGPGLNGEPKPT